MNTAFHGSSAQGFESRPTQVLEVGPVPTTPVFEDCPQSRSKTLPYLAFEPPVLAPPAQPVASAVATVVRAPSGRPPFAVAFMLMAAVMMLVASGGFAVTALLEAV